jgi:membrane-bound inhibitor of C-type lysozyme
VNSLDQSQDCTPTLKGADGKSYYRSPCMANSAINGSDSWILHMTNAGTTNITSAQFFDQLPVSGDKYLVASGMDRGSTFRPRMTGDLQVVGAPTGTTTTIEVTKDANACVGTWTTIPGAADACSGNTWTKVDGSTDWSAVTGIRVTLDFTTSKTGSLAPAQTADLTYSTTNEARTSEDASGAGTNVSAVNEFAWNQFGLLYSGESGARTIAPEKVGVNLRTGSLSVVKKVSGDAVSYAPDSFEATVSCSIPASGASKKVSLTFGAKQEQQLTVTMNKLPDGSYAAQRVSGIPLGAICHIAENGDTGTYGETTRKNAETDVNIVKADSYSSSTDQSGDPTNDVPAAQVATIDNEYEYSSLSVTKKVDTVADKGKFGPFDFTLSCTTSDNRTVKFGDSDSVAFSLAAGATWNAPENTIPANAKCALRETDADGAVSTVFTGDGVTQSAADAATIVVGSEKIKVVSSLVTNHYDGGTLTVTKKVAGEGAARYGSGKFTFHADCTYSGKSGEQRLLDQEFTLSAGESKVFGVFPSGTQCTVKETKSAGASSSSMNPEGGVVTIAKQTEQGVPSNVEVEATNTYDVGNVTIIKKRTGAGAEIRGKGPFEAQIVCTYLSDGTQVTADLPNNGKVELSAANGYTATVNGILLGAQCQITETKDGGADSTSMDPHDGKLTIAQDTSKNVVTITNVFKAKAPITPAANTPAKSLSKTGAAVATVVVAAVFCFAVGAGIMMVSRARRRGEPEDSGAHKA